MSIKYNPIGFNPDEVYDEEQPFILSNWTYQDKPQTYKQLMEERTKVKSEILGDVPTDLDSLKEIAASINNSAVFYQNVDTLLAAKAPVSNPTFTGVVSAPQVAVTDSMVLDGEEVPALKLKRVKNLRSDVQQQLDDISSGSTPFQSFSIGQPVNGSVLSITGNSNIGNSQDDVCRITGLTVADTVQLLALKVTGGIVVDALEISRLNGVTSNVQSQFTTVSSNVSGLDTRLSTAEGEIDTLISRADDNDTNDSQRSADISALQTSVSTLQSQMTTATSVNTAQATTLTSHGNSLTSLNNDFVTLENVVNGVISDVTALQSADVTHVGRLDAIEGINTTQNGRLDAIETLDISQNSTLTSHTSSISGINSSITTINSNATTLTGRVDGIDTSISELNTALGTKQNVINSSNRLNANLLADGSISNFELQCLDNVTGNVQQQIDGLLYNANLTGVPTAPTAISSTNTTQVATTAFVKTQIANLVNGAGSTLDTLNELATALGNDPNFATTMTNALGEKAPLVNPTFSSGMTIDTNVTVNSIAVTPVELSRLSGVSSNIQTQLNGKQATLTSSSNIVVAGLVSNSIVDNGNATIKGNTMIGDQISDSVTFYTGMNVVGLTKSHVSLGNVDNKSSSTIKSELLAADNTFGGTNTFSVLPLCSATVTNSNDLTNKTYVDASIASKADDNAVVKLSTNQTISGIKTFSSPPVMSGASISTATIPQSSVNGLSASLSAKQDVITGSTNLTIGNLTTTSITDNGALLCKGTVSIGDQVTDSVTFYSGMTVNGLVISNITGLQTALDGKATDSAVCHNTGTETWAGVKTFSSAPVLSGASITTGTIAQSSVTNLTTDLAAKAADSGVCHNTGTETWAGIKTFSSAPVMSGASISSGTIAQSSVTNLTSDLAAKTTLSAVQSNANTFSNSFVSQNTVSLSEFVNPVSVSSSIATCNYATSAIHLITPTSGNFTLALTNINSGSNTYRTYTVTLLIDASTYKVYANALTVNGTSRTLIYNGGSSAIPTLTSATYIVQTVSVLYGASSTVPIACITNIAPFYA